MRLSKFWWWVYGVAIGAARWAQVNAVTAGRREREALRRKREGLCRER